MAKMSQTVKEIAQIVVFLLVVGILVTVFVAYPLNRTSAFLARPDIDDFDADSLPANDPTLFLKLGAVVDTFRVDADGLTNLACVYLTPQADSSSPNTPAFIRGTALLLHDEQFDRASTLPLARALVDAGFTVCLYDQRASGFSTGDYHTDGELEAADLTELISYLGIRDRLHRPVIAVGWKVGADAALLVGSDEWRLDAAVAIEPYLTSDRWLDILMAEHEMYWIPFSHTLFKFWYELRSGYVLQYRGQDDLDALNCPGLILASSDHLEDEELTHLVELSGSNLQTQSLPDDPTELIDRIVQFATSLPQPAGEPAE